MNNKFKSLLEGTNLRKNLSWWILSMLTSRNHEKAIDIAFDSHSNSTMGFIQLPYSGRLHQFEKPINITIDRVSMKFDCVDGSTDKRIGELKPLVFFQLKHQGSKMKRKLPIFCTENLTDPSRKSFACFWKVMITNLWIHPQKEHFLPSNL